MPPLQFSAHFYCGQTAGYIKICQLVWRYSLSPGDFVLDGDPAPPPQKRGRSHPPHFSAHFCCGHTAGCIKMPLGMEVGDFVLDVDPVPPQKRCEAPSPIFGPCLLWPNGWMDQDGTWYRVGPWSRPHCARWGPSSLLQKGTEPPILAHFIVAKRWMHQDATWYGVTVCLSPGDCVR